MARKVIAAFLRVVLRVFFRRIEVAGDTPPGPVIFAINHPNALIDPLFLLAFAPRPVSFLAKAPILRYPLIGWIARGIDTIPVYRRQDNMDPAKNRETFGRSREVLQKGGAIAIFPEGTTHSDPQLRELKTGAARIALGAEIPLTIIPTGLYYTAKQTFRSSVLMYFGTPIAVQPEKVDENGEPDRQSVERLTSSIDSALDDVTLQADSHAALELIARAEDIFSAGEDTALAQELELRRRFVAGYTFLREHDPARLTRLESMIRKAHVADDVPAPVRAGNVLLAPVGIGGVILHWPVYRLIGFLATHFAGNEDELVATIKVIAGMLLYPILWIAVAIVFGFRFDFWMGLSLLFLQPIIGWIALMTVETFEAARARLNRSSLQGQQQAIREEILSVAKSMSSSLSSPAAPSRA